MDRKKTTVWLGVIILGALGNALWELAKPLLGWAWSAGLTIATLGVDSLRDGMYADAGHSLGISGPAASLAPALLGAIAGIAGMIILSVKYYSRGGSSLFAFPPLLLLTIMALSSTVFTLRNAYVEGLKNHYARLIIIGAPFIEPLDAKKLDSEFIRLENRDQYIKIIGKLHMILRENGIEPPLREFF